MINCVEHTVAKNSTIHPNYECTIHVLFKTTGTFKENPDELYDAIKSKLGQPGIRWSLSADWASNEIMLFLKDKSDMSYLKLFM